MVSGYSLFFKIGAEYLPKKAVKIVILLGKAIGLGKGIASEFFLLLNIYY